MHNISNAGSLDMIMTDFSKTNFAIFLNENIDSTKQIFKKKKDILAENEKVMALYVVEKGQIVVTKNNEFLDILGAGDIVGFTDIFVQSKSEYAFTVISKEAVVEKYRQEDVLRQLRITKNSFFYHYVHMQQQFERLVEKEVLVRMTPEHQIGAVLADLTARFGETMADDELVKFPKSISRGNLASLLNIAHYKLTEVFNYFQDIGIIYPMRREFFVNTHKLQEMLDRGEL